MSTPPRAGADQRPRRPADRKDQLTAVASALFTERGYRAVGVDDIAAAAGVTGPALYRHFPDKRAILARVVLAGVADLEACTAEALAAPAGSRADLVLTRVAEVAVRRPDAAVLWRWAGADLGDADRAQVRARSWALLQAWSATLLAEGAVRGSGPTAEADAELAAWAVMSVMGSPTAHRSRLGAATHAALLVGAARRVIAADLPAAREAGAPVPQQAGAEAGTRREQLLVAASGLFRDRGYHAVSIADLGAAVGIAGPSVYRHVPSKAAVLVAICRRSAQRLEAAADDVVAGAGGAGPAEVLRALVGSYVGVLTGTPDLVVAFTADHTLLTPAERAELLDAQRAYVARWVDALRAVHPELGAPAARVLVHAALGIANDVARTRRLTARPRWRAELVALACAALDV